MSSRLRSEGWAAEGTVADRPFPACRCLVFPFEVTECTHTYEKCYFKSGPNRAFTEAGEGMRALGVVGVEVCRRHPARQRVEGAPLGLQEPQALQHRPCQQRPLQTAGSELQHAYD